MLQGNSWRLGRIGGVEVRIDPSWSIIALLVGYSFYLLLSDRFTDRTTGFLLPLAIVMALLFFSSVLLHELAHSWLSLARGVEVKGITLFLFGGATHADLDTREPNDELWIALVGPLSSFAMAAFFWGATVVIGDGPLAFATGHLGWINLALAVFNLLPGFPLDGGRVLRSLIWRSSGDLVKATRIASRAGRLLGGLIIAVGIFEVLFLGALVGGLWLVAIGWFLAQAATSSFTHLQIKVSLQDVPAARLMTSELHEMPAGIDVQTAVDDYFMQYNYNTFPVVARGRTVGLITMSSIREVPRDQWRTTTVDDIAEPLSDLCTVGPHHSVGDVVDKLMRGEVGRVVVVQDGDVLGLITPRDLIGWLQRAQQLGDIEGRLSLR